MIVEPCSNQPSSSPFLNGRVAVDRRGAAIVHVHHDIEEVQADAGDQDRRHRHQGDEVAAGEPGADHRPLVLAEQSLDALERDRIDVPGVAGDVGDPLDRAVMRRMEAVVHARGEPQRRRRCRRGRPRPGPDRPAGRAACRESPWPAAARCPRSRRRRRRWRRTGLSAPAGSASTGRAPGFSARVKQACRLLKDCCRASLRSRSANSRQIAIDARATSGFSILAEPADPARRQPPRDAVGQQEVDVLLVEDLQQAHGATAEARDGDGRAVRDRAGRGIRAWQAW